MPSSLNTTDELWLVTGVYRCTVTCPPGGTSARIDHAPGFDPHRLCSDLILQGFHPSTKELLHTYGPFDPEELIDFAAIHSITLPAAR